MGTVRMGIPEKIVQDIVKQSGIKVFVETGTYMADTTVWASNIFDRVYTIEASKELCNEAIRKHGSIRNVKFLFGNSRDRLKEITVDYLDTRRALFWLDAHWSGGGTYGENDECPLMDELKIITKNNNEHFILIDDARLFLAPPPAGFKIAKVTRRGLEIRSYQPWMDNFQHANYVAISGKVVDKLK